MSVELPGLQSLWGQIEDDLGFNDHNMRRDQDTFPCVARFREHLSGDPVPLFTHPAPAAPQAEPIDPHMIVAEDRFPDEQAEPSDDNELAEPKHEEQPLRDLLAIIHCDGGHHTGAVGIKQSITDALATVTKMKYKLAMAKREPLTVSRILEIEADAIRQWRDNGRIIEFTVVFARMIEHTHGIGGDDAE